MAKRKSMNRRLSRYSRGSTGSAILDNDTEILGDEQSFWWKNLENNTIVRHSTESTLINQTSRRLDSSSRLEMSNVKDGWWKALENSDISDTSRIVAEKAHTDAVRNLEIMSSESEEESRIQRRKLPLRAVTRRTQGSNAFLKILNESRGSVASEPAQRSTRISLNNSSLSEIPPTQPSRQNAHQDGSTDLSETTDSILKPKPKIFARRQLNRSSNVFDNVLKEDVQSSPSTRMPMRDLKIELSKIEPEKTTKENGTTISKQTRASRLTLSFSETNDHDASHFPVPKAQSTIIESSAPPSRGSKVSDGSDTESEIIKPKSRFLKRYRKSDQNAFEDILADETILEVQTENEKDISIRSNAQNASLQKLPTMSPTVRLTRIPISRDGSYVAANASIDKQNAKKSILNEMNDSVSKLEEGSKKYAGNVPVENVDKFRDAIEASSRSRSDSKYSRSSAKSLEKVGAYQDASEEEKHISPRRISVRSTAEKENLSDGNQRILRKSGHLSKDVQESLIDSDDMTLRLSSFSADDNLEMAKTSKDRGKDKDLTGNERLKEKDDVETAMSTSVTSRGSRQRTSKSGILKNAKENVFRSSTPLSEKTIADRYSSTRDFRKSRTIAEDETIRSTNDKSTKGSNRLTEGSVEESLNDESGPEENRQSNVHVDRKSKGQTSSSLRQSNLEKQSKKSTGSKKMTEDRMSVRSQSENFVEVEYFENNNDITQATLTEQLISPRKSATGSLRKSAKHNDSRTSTRMNEVDETELAARSTRESVSHIISDSENETTDVLKKRNSRSTSRFQKQLTTILSDDSEKGEEENVTQSKSPRKSERHLSSRVPNNVSKEENGNLGNRLRSRLTTPNQEYLDAEPKTPQKKLGKSLSRSRKKSTSKVPNDFDHEDVEDVTKRRSENTSSSKKRSALIVFDDSDEEEQSVRESHGKSISRSRAKSTSSVQHHSGSEMNDSLRKTDGLTANKSNRRLMTLISDESAKEEELEENNRKTRSKSLSKSRAKSTSSVQHHSGSEMNDSVRKTDSQIVNKSNRRLTTLISEESAEEEEQEENNRATRSKSLSRSRKKSTSSVWHHSGSEMNDSVKKTDSLIVNKSNRRLTTLISEESAEEEEQEENNRATRSKSLSRSRKKSTSSVQHHSGSEMNDSVRKTDSLIANKSNRRLTTLISEDSAEEEEQDGAQRNKTPRPSRGASAQSSAKHLEIETIENVSQRYSESTNRSKKRLTMRASDDSDKEEQNSRAKRSKSINRSQQQSVQHAVNHSEKEMGEDLVRRRSENARMSKRRITGQITEEAGTEDESVQRKESKSPSKSQKRSTALIQNEPRQEQRPLSLRERFIPEKSVSSPRSNLNKSVERPIPPTFDGPGSEDFQRVLAKRASSLHQKNQSGVASKDVQNGEEESTSRITNGSKVSQVPSVSYETDSEDQETNLSKNLGKQRNEERSTQIQQGISKSHARSSVSKLQRNIEEFFRPRTTALVSKTRFLADKQPSSQMFSDSQRIEEVKKELEKVKEREMAVMKLDSSVRPTKPLREKEQKNKASKSSKPFERRQSARQIDKAYLVNGKVYKTPRLPRPKYWVTDRLYNFLWKRMEPKHHIETRVRSERFVQQLANVMALIVKRKSYEKYNDHLDALMMEMARLGIIRTPSDFYHFCQDFLPYEYRIKTVPMLLPGNKSNIPYDPEKLHTPLIDS